MDDTALLQRTLRRCTAVLVIALALVTASLDNRTTATVAVAVGFGAVLYLAGSFVFVPEDGDTAEASPD